MAEEESNPAKEKTPYSELDPVRRRIVTRMAELKAAGQRGISYSAASKACEMNVSYIHTFVNYGTPRRLDEEVRAKLAAFLQLDERELRLGEYLGEDQRPYHATSAVPAFDIEPAEGELFGEMLAKLDSLYREERMELLPSELGEAAFHLHADLMALCKGEAAGYRRALDEKLADLRDFLRRERSAILKGRP